MIKESAAAHTHRNLSPRGAEPKNIFSKRDSIGHASEQSSDGNNSPGKRRGPTAGDCCPGLLDGALTQQADPEAAAVLIGALSPALLRFFRTQDLMSREQADDLAAGKPGCGFIGSGTPTSEASGIVIWRIAGGKRAERWAYLQGPRPIH